MLNLPEMKIGLVAVSRDCFPITLSETRRGRVAAACAENGLKLYEAKTIIENEKDAKAALSELAAAGANALVVYLGNFGPEGPETYLAEKFDGPVMFCAAAEETQDNLTGGRGDAYCGMLNASYSLGLRGVSAYIPEYPVGTAEEVAGMIGDFSAIARVVVGVKNLKILSFGPRPQDFLACNAPIKGLYDLGASIEENSELDLFESFNAHAGDKRIDEVARDMASELAGGNRHPGILPKLAQYELTLLDWYEAHRGAADFAVFAGKCWPAFQTQFGFVPCYVNSRLAARGIPVACETDIYGALTEFMITLATGRPATLLDINNSVPKDMFDANKKVIGDYRLTDLFMGFHCGNTAACLLKNPEMCHQLIMKRSLEPDGEPNITRGTLEGAIAPSDVTLFRLQSTAGGKLRSYVAQGEILDVDPRSFGSIAVFAVPEMGRFYRHVLIEKQYPHHAGVAFSHAGKVLFEALKLLGVEEIDYNRPAALPYPKENPFS